MRYYAGARAATGIEQEQLPVAGPIALTALAEQLAGRHGAPLARVLEAASFLVDEVAGPTDRTVAPGATIDVLPPFAGG